MPELPLIPEPSSKIDQSPELPEGPTGAQLAEVCKGVLSAEDCADIEVMEATEGFDSEELEGFVFGLLIANGVEDPEAFLAEQGILEPPERATSLPEQLGFVETPELAQLHAGLVEALRASEGVAKHAVEYQAAAEAIVDKMEDDPRGQIALTLQLGLIAQEAGHLEMYVGYLEQARSYADNLDMDELVATIDSMIGEI